MIDTNTKALLVSIVKQAAREAANGGPAPEGHTWLNDKINPADAKALERQLQDIINETVMGMVYDR